MRSTVFCFLIVSFAGVCGATAAENSLGAATSRVTTFQMSGITFAFPIPDGFCLPTGRYATQASQTANGDPANITDVSFDDCAAMAANGNLTRWGMVKTPRSLASTDVGTRQSVIAELKGQFASGEFERSMNQGMSNASPGGVTTKVAPLGTDPNGAYVGGTVSVNGRIFAAAWGMTAVKRRLLALYIYIPYNSQADVQAVINMVRTATARMVAANGGN